MNKRARTRLIGVTAIILIAVAAVFFGLSGNQAAYYKTVEEAAKDKTLVGERVKIGGAVVTGSWDRKSNPMRFVIRDEADKDGTGATLKVVYNGPVPSTFGDGVTAIVTGPINDQGEIEAQEMITKCPSKYESAEGAVAISKLPEGKPVRAFGYVKAGTIAAPGGVRFVVTEEKTGGAEAEVVWEGALPNGMADGSKVVMTGSLEADGKFVASDVALEEGQK